nr:RNA-directed DNA polymerase, eukaryota [Tanacetum cinerariifolium]
MLFLEIVNSLDVHAIHEDYGTDFSFYSHVREHGVWGRIVNSINSMHEKEFIPLSFLRKKVGDGLSTKFWHDVWIGDSSLQSKFSRLYRIASNKDCTVRDVWNNGWDFSWSRPILGVTLSDSKDIWTWSIGSPSFSVKCTREHIDKRYLPDGDSKTRWNHSLPKKINIFIWKALRDRLPTRWNLSRKGIELDTLLCPICDSNIETVDHTFWTCSLATSIWNKIFDWLDIDAPSPVHIHDIFTWINDLRVSTTKKSILEVICGVALWALWQFRNGLVFGSSPSNRCTLFDSIIDTSYRLASAAICKNRGVIVRVLPNATSATELAIWPVTVGVLLLLTIRETSLAMNVGIKGTTGVISQRRAINKVSLAFNLIFLANRCSAVAVLQQQPPEDLRTPLDHKKISDVFLFKVPSNGSDTTCGSFDFNRSLSLNEYKGLATLDKSKTTKTKTLFKDSESMRKLDSKQ